MFFAQTADWTKMGRALVADLSAEFGARGLPEGKFALVLTAPASFGAEGFAHRGAQAVYPAGLTAPFHLLHGLSAQETGRVQSFADLDQALRDMALWPSDSAANYVIDCLTGTTGDTPLQGAEYLDWASKRARLDTFYWQMGWPEWDGCRIVQKQGQDRRYGREAQLAGSYGEGLNALTPACVARLLWEMFEGDFPLSAENLRRAQSYLARDPTSPDAVFPNFGLAGFLGSGLPDGVKIWSKTTQTGWTGDAKTAWMKHEMLRVVARGLRPLHVVMMSQSRALVEDGDGAVMADVGHAIWQACAPLLRLPVTVRTGPSV